MPDLGDLRAQPVTTQSADPPTPGSFDGGVLYKDGDPDLSAPDGADFFAHMVVYPDGMGQLPDWLFTPATNRMDFGIEVVGIYLSEGEGSLGVYDWSCHKTEQGTYEVVHLEPCPNPGSAWVTAPLSNFPCLYERSAALGGEWHYLLPYHNITEKTGTGPPATWVNRVVVFDYCLQAWLQIYEHEYSVDPNDCGSNPPPPDGCGRWAGVLETFFPHPFPEIPTLGFWRMGIAIEGGFVGFLREEDIEFDPVADEWDLTVQQLGHTFSAGSYLDSDADTVPDGSDPDDDGDGVNDVDEVVCGGDPLDHDVRPERIDGDFAGVDDDGDTLIDEALPGGVGAYDCDGDGYTGTAENHVYSYVSQTNGDQKTCQQYDTNFPDPNQPFFPSLRWPSDFRGDSISFNDIDILDLASFNAPIKYLNTNVGTRPGDVRWDVVPGKSGLTYDINIVDYSAISAPGAQTGAPPMLNGVRALNGPPCPWPP